MNINLLSMETIVFDKSITTKAQLFDMAAMLFEKTGVVTNALAYKNDLFIREKQTSTGIEDEFGIPHAKSQHVIRPGLAFFKTSPILDYIALDDTYIKYVFIIAMPKESVDEHLFILSHLARKLMSDEFRTQLKNTSNYDEVMKIMNLNKFQP